MSSFTINPTENNIQRKTVRFVNQESVKRDYEILNYSMEDNQDVGLYRSVIIDPDTKELLSFAPPKSIELAAFQEKYNTIDDVKFQMNEIIEGTMINLFYDSRISSWEIATKSAVSGNYWFFRNQYTGMTTEQLTFRNMFIEGLGYKKDTLFQDIALFNSLKQDYIYNFVVQHPDNHIVLDVKEPKVYLVSIFKKLSSNTVQMVPLELFKNQNDALANIHYPENAKTKTYDVKYDTAMKVGYMVWNIETGDRVAIENPAYMVLKQLRGNDPNMLYHYLCFNHIDQSQEFLKHFPRYKSMFQSFERQINDFIRNIHDCYVCYYVQKRGKQIRIPEHIMPHIWKLHFEVHIPSGDKTSNRTIIRKNIVNDYFNNMEPKEKWYWLNKFLENRLV